MLPHLVQSLKGGEAGRKGRKSIRQDSVKKPYEGLRPIGLENGQYDRQKRSNCLNSGG